VRVIATTNRDLEQWVKEGRFREDLFFRLNVVPSFLPPLRARLEDLESLCEYFLGRCAEREGTSLKVLSQSAQDLLRGYSWPGNVRELENLMERISILAPSDVITDDVVRHWLDFSGKPSSGAGAAAILEPVTLERMEKELVQKTLDRYSGHRQKTAAALGIGVRTLGMKIKRWKMEGSAF